MEKGKIRVLMLVSGLDIGGAHGGAERFGLELSRQLDANAIDIVLCAFWRRGGKAESHWYKVLQDGGINVFFAAKWRGKYNIFEYIRGIHQIARQISRVRVDIIHSNFQMGTVAALYLKTFGYTRKAMRTAHAFHEWGDGIIAFILRLVFQNWVYPLLLDGEVGVSQAAVEKLSNHAATRLWHKHPQLIYNAISPDVFENKENNQTFNLNAKGEAGIIVGSIGRIIRKKGFNYLIQAMPRILSEMPNVRLVIIGEGEFRFELQQYVKRTDLDDKVRFLGQCEDPLPMLKKMDLFVLPSLYENFPTVILESMACGIPVVATDIPGTRELIKPGITGWLVRPADAQALGESIIEALKAPELRAKISSRAREEAKNFSFTTIARKYEVLYQSIAGNH